MNGISILTQDQLDDALAQIFDVIENDLERDEIESLGELDVEDICYDVGVKPTEQVIAAVFARLDRE